MFFVALLPVLSALTGVSMAQAIDPETVSYGDREQWCNSQTTACPLLCLQYPGNSATTRANDCDPDTLQFSCVCSKGQSPNASEYSQTIPYFECTETNSRCVANCAGNSQCQYDCRANNPCGAQNPKRVKAKPTTTTATSPSSTSTSGDSSDGSDSNDSGDDGFGDSSGSSSGGNAGKGTNADGTSGAAALALGMGRSWGLAAVLGSVFAAVAIGL